MITYLQVGDWSRDGHNQFDVYAIEHNLESHTALFNAYKTGSEIVGFKLDQDVASEYEESKIEDKYYDLLCNYFSAEQLEDIIYREDDEDVHYAGHHFQEGSDSFAQLWFMIACLGSDTLEGVVIDTSRGSLHAGGYGLFGS